MDDYSAFVPNVHFEQIPIKNLVSNQEYQRNLSQTHIERAAAAFDLYQINPIKVSRRDGINYVFNGQHTIEIVAAVSGSRETPVWCMIYDDLSYEHEADIFANQQRFVKQLVPYEVFVANLEAGNSDELMIRDLVESYGLTIGDKRCPGNICAVATLVNIFKKYGYHTLNRVLRLVIGAFEGDQNSFSANMLNAVTRLVVVYGDNLDDELFKQKVGAMSIKQLTRTAKERRLGSMGFAEAMVIEYNGRKKSNANRLFINKLYAKENSIFKDIEEEQMDDMLDEDEIDAQGDEVDEDTDEPATHDSLDETDE
jgi:hypothetical protein